MQRISIIIPILNEAKGIKNLLDYLIENAAESNFEIIVVDGGSSDNSQQLVESYYSDNVKLVTSQKGRAKQMNVGAKYAKNEILYFLHADSFPPKQYDTLLKNEVKKGNRAGCFIMKFDSNHWWLKLAGWLTRLPIKASRGGDQSQFITKELFSQLGGYNENYSVFEDYILISQLYAIDEFTLIPKWLTTSARRYRKNGVWKLQYHFYIIYLKKWQGASASELYTYYQKYIK